MCFNVLQCVIVYCNVLQCVTMCSSVLSVLQCVVVSDKLRILLNLTE